MDAEKAIGIGFAVGIIILFIMLGATVMIVWAREDPHIAGCEEAIRLLQPTERLEGFRTCLENKQQFPK